MCEEIQRRVAPLKSRVFVLKEKKREEKRGDEKKRKEKEKKRKRKTS